VQPHWFWSLQVQVVALPQSAAPVAIEHSFVQKNVLGSPKLEHSPAWPLLPQSSSLAQNLPTPSSLPVSPGLPHVEANASMVGAGAASGAWGVLAPPHAATTIAIITALIAMHASGRRATFVGTPPAIRSPARDS
jgi:hypothetical protein